MRTEALKYADRFYLTDGGLETYMIFDKGFELPCFSSAALLETPEGRSELTKYFERFVDIADRTGRGFVMDVPTWRAGVAWASELGLSQEEVLTINRKATTFVADVRDRLEKDNLPIVLNGLIGPSGDAYAPDNVPTAENAFVIHAPQIRELGRAGVDMVSAMTLTHVSEAIGIAYAAKEIDLPVVIAFTVEVDGFLPSGQSLERAINEVDAETNEAPLYYMINCAHPDHFAPVFSDGGAWLNRIGGLRTNASRLSHEELDAAEELDSGNPSELSRLHAPLLELLPNVRVLGGCCGTDHRHVECLAHVAA